MAQQVDTTFKAIRAHASRLRRAATEQPRILIVDDDAFVRAFVNRVLRHAGYTTVVATDGPEALDIAADGGLFDLLLTDVVMPDMRAECWPSRSCNSRTP